MRLFVFTFAVIATASAASLVSDYLPPVVDNSLPIQEYIPPAITDAASAPSTDDGYRYKVVRKLKFRHRRDVSELPSSEYLPAVEESVPQEITVVAEPEEQTVVAQDGYRYKTVRRLKYRHRRDVSELPLNQYLPAATEEVVVEAAPEELTAPVEAAAEQQTELADDGYRYKTIRRIRYRHRRDVNELPANDYLPPTEEAAEVQAAQETPVTVEEPSAVLADDGYRYKTIRRIRYRRRRDVNELPANDYLPPTEEAAEVQAVQETPVTVEEPSAVLADDGYRYKTIRRIRYRRRRDVNELPANDYLPPTEEAAEVKAVQETPVTVEEPSAVLADDGYRYKTVRRIRYRRRRDVNELPANDYLPPTEEAAEVKAAQETPVTVEEPSAVLADDGYRYKTVRRIRYRRRRDVNELPANDYLPPTEESVEVEAAQETPVTVEEPSTVLANDGYRYKTVRRIRYRRRRDVNELPANDYLPPAAAVKDDRIIAATAPAVIDVPQADTVLANDGYRYKTVRRLRHRHRRDVNELVSNDYLPPAETAQEEVTVAAAPAEDTVAVEARSPVETAVLANDGYRYKTVRRIRYRRRRDVNELASNEYLPPVDAETEQLVSIVSVPEVEQTVLADDGYRYKTVRRLRHRQRRDVNELPSSEYLPALTTETVANEYVAAPEEVTILGDDGYRYKTVRKLKYRSH